MSDLNFPHKRQPPKNWRGRVMIGFGQGKKNWGWGKRGPASGVDPPANRQQLAREIRDSLCKDIGLCNDSAYVIGFGGIMPDKFPDSFRPALLLLCPSCPAPAQLQLLTHSLPNHYHYLSFPSRHRSAPHPELQPNSRGPSAPPPRNGNLLASPWLLLPGKSSYTDCALVLCFGSWVANERA